MLFYVIAGIDKAVTLTSQEVKSLAESSLNKVVLPLLISYLFFTVLDIKLRQAMVNNASSIEIDAPSEPLFYL
jgi:hypothetical protein